MKETSEMVYYSLIWQVWDLIKLADYLTHREDIDPSRIGISGESFGGWSKKLKGICQMACLM